MHDFGSSYSGSCMADDSYLHLIADINWDEKWWTLFVGSLSFVMQINDSYANCVYQSQARSNACLFFDAI